MNCKVSIKFTDYTQTHKNILQSKLFLTVAVREEVKKENEYRIQYLIA